MSGDSSWPAEINLAFAEALYADYLRDPSRVSDEWRRYFDSLAVPKRRQARDDGQGAARPAPSLQRRPHGQPPAPRRAGSGRAKTPHRTAAGAAPAATHSSSDRVGAAALQHCVDKIVSAYRARGHMEARIDPLGMRQVHTSPELDPSFVGLGDEDLDRKISPATLSGCSLDTPRAVIERLKETYTRSVGAQFMHIDDSGVREWIQERMESVANRVQLSEARQFRILTRLTDATIFEDFIQKKFVGAKSFSLEGCETLIPLLDLLIERASHHGVNDLIIGMAHRGRLNVLANILGKSAREIFREFADVDQEKYSSSGGDVKYHLGYRSWWRSSQGEHVRLSLCFNPSHLEYVNPVAVGRTRARQDRRGDRNRTRGLCILLHGDAAFAGEGIVQETLNMSQLPGYTVGGTIHIIVNNQIGFTTQPAQGRSSIYAAGVAKMLQIPILHVNGEDPEAVAQAVRLAVDFRKEFRRDVVIDMYGYRRRGHNETDDPRYTQPLMYEQIAAHKPVREAYLEHLLNQGGVSRKAAQRIATERRQHLENELASAKHDHYIDVGEQVAGDWTGFNTGTDEQVAEIQTGVRTRRLLAAILDRIGRTPDSFNPHPRLERMLKARTEMARGQRPVDWAAAEAVAFGTLLVAGHRIRLTGQDCERGTFSHRHAVLRDFKTGKRHIPLQHLTPRQAEFEIHNSPLAEGGPLGFEYGYSMEWPDGLTVWEAQFGDFANSAQVIIDQFISSGEDKWRLWSGLVMLLPHGFEGQGPEHSSARLERFLQLAAEDNIQVACPTTAAQYFHLVRRQILRPWRKPLIVMAPKSLLRHPQVVSEMEELATGTFQRILVDPVKNSSRVKRVLACSGKIYYELEAAREKSGAVDLAIVRLEQLYPLSSEALQAAVAPFKRARLYWIQEEPRNMGAWRHLQMSFGGAFTDVVCRPESASPATGSPRAHKREQKRLVERALAVG